MASAEKTQIDMLDELKKMSESMTGIKSDTDVIGLAGGIVTKLIQSIIGSVVQLTKGFDAMRISNADLNVNFSRMQDTITTQGVDIGTLTEHSQMQLNLHRIGYKQINKDLREQLVWLDKTDKQGKDLVKFMSTLIEKGADVKTQTAIALEVARISEFTGQSARAAISAADQMGDQITVLKAFGLDGDMLTAVMQAAEEMPQTNATTLGKFVKDMIEPKDITKSILLGTYQSGKDLLRENATIQERVSTIMKSATEASERSQQFLKQAGPDPFLLKTFKNTFVGPLGILAMQVDAAELLASSSKGIMGGTKMFTTDVDRFKRSTEQYEGSFEAVSDSLQLASEGFAKEILPELVGGKGKKGLLSEMSKLIPDVRTTSRLMTKLINMLAKKWELAEEFWDNPVKSVIKGEGEKVQENWTKVANVLSKFYVATGVMKPHETPQARRKLTSDAIMSSETTNTIATNAFSGDIVGVLNTVVEALVSAKDSFDSAGIASEKRTIQARAEIAARPKRLPGFGPGFGKDTSIERGQIK